MMESGEIGTNPWVRWLLELTQIPTAAGRESAVVSWIRAWVDKRPELALREDAAGNLTVEWRAVRQRGGGAAQRQPLFITAHLDHPAFVVESVSSPTTLVASFRGGVMDAFFEPGPESDGERRFAPVVVHCSQNGAALPARVVAAVTPAGKPFKRYRIELSRASGDVKAGDVATWDLPPARIDADGLVHTHACDDLAAVAAALAALDECLKRNASDPGWVERGGALPRLLFTRAEEIGFIGATAACRLGTMPAEAKVIALENSRSFPDSPIGGGPIVRVGDRLSVFSPTLTAAIARRAEQAFSRPAQPAATQSVGAAAGAGRPWQRKLMAGGACEATVYCAYGYDATCLCLPLGNYHNMANLAELQAGTYDRSRLGPPRAACEFISVHDYLGLVELLVAACEDLPGADSVRERVDRLHDEHAFVLSPP